MVAPIVCIASSELRANEVVSRLRLHNFHERQISVLFPDGTCKRTFGDERISNAPGGMDADRARASVGNGSLSLFIGIGFRSINGEPPFVAAGPIVDALSGITSGEATGRLAGALIKLGLPESEARHYEDKVKEGHILISFHSEDRAEISQVVGILAKSAATDLGGSAKPPAPSRPFPLSPFAVVSTRGGIRPETRERSPHPIQAGGQD